VSRIRTHSSALEKVRNLRLDGLPTAISQSLGKDEREALRLRFAARKTQMDVKYSNSKNAFIQHSLHLVPLQCHSQNNPERVSFAADVFH